MNIAVCGYYGFQNTGDEAILDAIIGLIKAKLKRVKIIVFSGNPEITQRRHGVEAVHIGYGFNIKRWLFPPTNLKVLTKHIGVLKQSELLIVGGGGLIHDRGFYRGFYMPKFSLTKILLAKILGKKVMVFAVGVTKIRKITPKILFTWILNKADVITVRDYESKQNLVDCGVNKEKVIVAVDPSILLSPVKKEIVGEILEREKIQRDRNRVGICIRWNPLRGLINGPINKNFMIRMAVVIDFMISAFNVDVVLIPMQFPPRATNDIQVMEKVVSKIKNKDRVQIIRGNHNPKEILAIIGTMDLTICMRLHSLIFSTIMNVPYVGIIYHPKVESFLRLVGLSEYAFSDLEQDVELMCNIIRKAWLERVTIRRRLERQLKRLRQLNRKNIVTLESLLSSTSNS